MVPVLNLDLFWVKRRKKSNPINHLCLYFSTHERQNVTESNKTGVAGVSALHNSSPFIYHPRWLITWLHFNFVGWVPHRASCSAAHLPSLAAPPYHPNTPTCLWKTVIEWVYVVKLINHINLYLLVGWLKAMTIRLMKLVNSSYPHYTPNYNEQKKKA